MTVFYPKNKGDEIKELLALALSHYENERADLRRKSDANVSPYHKLKPYPSISDYKSGWVHLDRSNEWFSDFHYHGYANGNLATTSAVKERYAQLSKLLDKYVSDCESIALENEPLAAENKELIAKIKAIMDAAGIPESYYAYEKPSPRAKEKSVKKPAGYIQDLNRLVQTAAPVRVQVDDLRQRLKSKYNDAFSKASALESEKEKQREKERALHELALFRAKYTPENPHSYASNIIDSVLSKNKYLHMAYWLERQRGDWSDGFWQAELALNAFVPESDLDNDILECIQGIYDSSVENGDIDGRVFRDCEYNYGVLYGMVEDEQLKADLNRLKEIVDSY